MQMAVVACTIARVGGGGGCSLYKVQAKGVGGWVVGKQLQIFMYGFPHEGSLHPLPCNVIDSA